MIGAEGNDGAERPRLTEPDLTELSRLSQLRILQKGQSLFLAGELSRCVLVVKSGRLKLSHISAEGRELIVSFLDPGDLLVIPGDRLVKGSVPLVEGLGEAVLLLVPQSDFEAFLRARPASGLTVIRQLADRVRALEARIDEMVFKDTRGRLATTLLRLAEAYGHRGLAGAVGVGLPITQQDLANLIGASREMVSHALLQWKREGWIELHRRSIVIRRTEALESQESGR